MSVIAVYGICQTAVGQHMQEGPGALTKTLHAVWLPRLLYEATPVDLFFGRCV